MTEYESLIDRIETEHPSFITAGATPLPGGVSESIGHGTTIVAVKSKKGVVIGGDTRVSMGMAITNERKRKVHILDRYSAMGLAGTAATCLTYANLFSELFLNHSRTHRSELHFDTRSQVVSNTLVRGIAQIQMGLLSVPIMAGYQHGEGPRIVSYDVLGAPNHHRHYTALGSGGTSALSVCNALWKIYGGRQMTDDKAIDLVLDALVHSTLTQAGSSFPSLDRDIIPYAILIDEEGAAFVPQDTIAKKVSTFNERFGGV